MSEDDNDRIALAEIMKGFSDLMTIRSKRISQMEIGMSPYLLAALAIMSIVVIYPFFTAAPISASGFPNYVNAVCIMTLGVLLSFLLMTLFDIGSPFDGFWKIKTESFHEIKTLLEQEIGKQEPLQTAA